MPWFKMPNKIRTGLGAAVAIMLVGYVITLQPNVPAAGVSARKQTEEHEFESLSSSSLDSLDDPSSPSPSLTSSVEDETPDEPKHTKIMISNTAAVVGSAVRTGKRLRMPALFLCHGGGPMPLLPSPNGQENLIELWKQHRAELFPTDASLPKAILVVSAHYEERTMKVGGASKPAMLYDYGGFPPETYKVQYPAPGDPALATHIVDLINTASGGGGGIPTATLDAQRPFDHGVFIPLMFLFPEANIPVIPISVLASQDVGAHTAVGQALSSLRDEGVFILGSGSSSHNMRLRSGGLVGQAFNEKLASVITSGGGAKTVTRGLSDYLRWPGAHEAQLPGLAEHLMPLFTVLGTSQYFQTGDATDEEKRSKNTGHIDVTREEYPLQPPVVQFATMSTWVVTHFTFHN